MKLKLAEYSQETGKFERFLELGKDFGYCGNYIIVTEYGSILDCIKCEDYIRVEECYFRDNTDPLNRFDGLFDGRTYEGGRFVLIADDSDDIVTFQIDGTYAINTIEFLNSMQNCYVVIKENLGNLHENPELYKKIK